MSRLVSLLIVLLAIAVATPVLAEDRLSLSGAMRVRGFHIDIDGNDKTNTFADQRLRIGGKMSVAEGVSVTFRFDATESAWGAQPGFGGGRIPNDGSMQWDRAHLDVQKGMFHLRAGAQFVGFGLTGVDAQDNGLTLNIKGPVTVTAFYMLDKNNNVAWAPATGVVSSTTGVSSVKAAVPSEDNSDSHYFGLQVGHKTDAYAANVFFAGQKGDVAEVKATETAAAKAARPGEEVYVLGMTYAQNFDALNLYTELEYFFGDASETADAYGLQLFADLSAAVSETVTVGGQFFYAMGDDEDTQYTVIGNRFNDWDAIFDLATGSNITASSISGGNPYTVLGNGAGLYAGRVYANMKATDEVMVSASVLYGVDDEDKKAAYKDVLAVAAGMKYNFLPKASFGVQVQYTDKSKENTTASDLERFDVGTALVVSF